MRSAWSRISDPETMPNKVPSWTTGAELIILSAKSVFNSATVISGDTVCGVPDIISSTPTHWSTSCVSGASLRSPVSYNAHVNIEWFHSRSARNTLTPVANIMGTTRLYAPVNSKISKIAVIGAFIDAPSTAAIPTTANAPGETDSVSRMMPKICALIVPQAAPIKRQGANVPTG